MTRNKSCQIHCTGNLDEKGKNLDQVAMCYIADNFSSIHNNIEDFDLLLSSHSSGQSVLHRRSDNSKVGIKGRVIKTRIRTLRTFFKYYFIDNMWRVVE